MADGRRSESLFQFLCSYFQKVPTDAPQLELKANYGLVEPVPFAFPPASAQWTPEALATFDLTKRPKDDSVRARGLGEGSEPAQGRRT